MKKPRLLILILGVLLVSGCATYKYEGHNFPPLSSSNFPTFGPISEIPDGTKIKLAEGAGKTKMVFDTTYSRGEESVFSRAEADWEWDVNVVNNLIYNSHFIKVTAYVSGQPSEGTMRLESIHETSGKEIKYNLSFEPKENGPTADHSNDSRKQMSDYIKGRFAGLGKTVKTGDVATFVPNDVSGMAKSPGPNAQNTYPEIIKGMGVYKNSKVIVAEFSFDQSSKNLEGIMELRGKGYALYDAETFIRLFAEAVMYMSIFSAKEGTVYVKIDVRYETYDVKVKNIIDSPTLTGRGASKESGKSASERLEGLKRLKDKSLITDEEYEKKKKQILDEL